MEHQETGANGMLGPALPGGLDRGGSLVLISPKPPLRITGEYLKGGIITTNGCDGEILPVDYNWLMGDPVS